MALPRSTSIERRLGRNLSRDFDIEGNPHCSSPRLPKTSPTVAAGCSGLTTTKLPSLCFCDDYSCPVLSASKAVNKRTSWPSPPQNIKRARWVHNAFKARFILRCTCGVWVVLLLVLEVGVFLWHAHRYVCFRLYTHISRSF
jgi:hypothetical protein